MYKSKKIKKRNSRIINYFVPTTNYGTPELEAAVPGVSSYFNAIHVTLKDYSQYHKIDDMLYHMQHLKSYPIDLDINKDF